MARIRHPIGGLRFTPRINNPTYKGEITFREVFISEIEKPLESDNSVPEVSKEEAQLIRCDEDPKLQKGWQLRSHKKMEPILRPPKRIRLLFWEPQFRESFVRGISLLKSLEDKPVLNANLMDYLYDNPEKIPPECDNIRIFFFGTRYKTRKGLEVPFLLLMDGEVFIRSERIDRKFGTGAAIVLDDHPATP